jgi:hypothetical protein
MKYAVIEYFRLSRRFIALFDTVSGWWDIVDVDLQTEILSIFKISTIQPAFTWLHHLETEYIY